MTTSAAFVVFLFALVACVGERDIGRQVLLAEPASAPPDIPAACEITARRCSRCHPLDRLVQARVTSPGHWRTYVRRMRLTPGSGISLAEQDVITRCLVFRSFGATGLAELEAR
jgi:hypothetical protein